MRIAFGLEYCGLNFLGWQRLRRGRSVQACVESALSKIADHPVTTACAGRTDRGVHACRQVIHIDTTAERDMHGWILGTNCHLPDDISILWAQPVADRFHARFSATGRRYRYIIINRVARAGLYHGRVSCAWQPLDIVPMQAAADDLVGVHDFSAYRAVACQSKSARREVRELTVWRSGDFVQIEIEANAFLHHMVRNIAGVLMAIGTGKAPASWAREVLESRDRTLGGMTAPAEGLYLVDVSYAGYPDLPAARPDNWPPAGWGGL